MKFMLTFTWTPNPQARAEGIGRFQKTGGLPPPGVELLGRWTRADLSGGFDLLETDDPKKLVEFAYMWSDLMELGDSVLLVLVTIGHGSALQAGCLTTLQISSFCAR